MKNMKKITSLLCLLLMAVVFTFSGIKLVNAAPQTTTVSRVGVIEAKIGDNTSQDTNYSWAIYKTSDDVVAYCMDNTKAWPSAEGTEMTLAGEADAGIKYILENGYPNKTITGNSEYDRYITQGAVWMYSGQLGTTFMNADDPHDLRGKMQALVSGAQNASSSSSDTKAYIFAPSDSTVQRVVALYTETTPTPDPEPTPEPEKVCVDYVIVGNVIPDPAKTDPTPSEKCFNKGTEYDQEKGLTTRQSNCKFNGWYTKSNLTGKWTNGTALNNNLTLYGAWDCGTPVKVPATAAQTPLIILGVGLTAIAIGAGVYIYRNKKLNSNK